MQTDQGYASSEGHAFWEGWYRKHQQRVLTLADIQYVGEQLYHNRQACGIYGYPPDQAYALGIRMAGRTLIEYSMDAHARAIATAAQRYLYERGMTGPIAVVDLFAGAGNLLYHIARTLQADQVFGIDADPLVAQLTARNLAIVASPWQITQGSWQDFDPRTLKPAIQTVVIIVDPPWGRGHTSNGLDLRATEPPVPEILSRLMPRVQQPAIWLIKTFEHTEPASLDAITGHFAHYEYDTLNNMVPGTNVGYLLGTSATASQAGP